MRNAFAAELTALAGEDKRLILLSGDIGNRLFNPYKANFPERFFNCGVAEANMTSVAAGMALCGLRPVTYTITSFNTTRCLEQIKIDICYHNLPVIVVGVGSGLSYAGLGPTHHSCEDIALLRSLPNMTIICPGDVWEVRLALRAAITRGGPTYIRLGKKNEPVIHEQAPDFQIGRGILLRPGNDISLLSTGNMLPLGLQAAEELSKRGISASVVSFHTVKPLDEELLFEAFAKFKVVATLEEHSLQGGFGSGVAEWMADHVLHGALLCRLGIADQFLHEAGDQAYARKYFGLTPGGIADNILRFMEKSKSS
jgi:transketolase